MMKKTLRRTMVLWMWAKATTMPRSMAVNMIFSLTTSPSSMYFTWSSTRSGRGGSSLTRWLVMIRAMVVTTMLTPRKSAASKVFHGSSGKWSFSGGILRTVCRPTCSSVSVKAASSSSNLSNPSWESLMRGLRYRGAPDMVESTQSSAAQAGGERDTHVCLGLVGEQLRAGFGDLLSETCLCKASNSCCSVLSLLRREALSYLARHSSSCVSCMIRLQNTL